MSTVAVSPRVGATATNANVSSSGVARNDVSNKDKTSLPLLPKRPATTTVATTSRGSPSSMIAIPPASSLSARARDRHHLNDTAPQQQQQQQRKQKDHTEQSNNKQQQHLSLAVVHELRRQLETLHQLNNGRGSGLFDTTTVATTATKTDVDNADVESNSGAATIRRRRTAPQASPGSFTSPPAAAMPSSMSLFRDALTLHRTLHTMAPSQRMLVDANNSDTIHATILTATETNNKKKNYEDEIETLLQQKLKVYSSSRGAMDALAGALDEMLTKASSTTTSRPATSGPAPPSNALEHTLMGSTTTQRSLLFSSTVSNRDGRNHVAPQNARVDTSPPNAPATGSATKQQNTNNNKKNDKATSGSSSSPPTTSLRSPPLIEDNTCFSSKQDSLSLIQNHRLGAPHLVDCTSFLSEQDRIAQILFSGWDEIIHQVQHNNAERAVVLKTIRDAVRSVLSNAFAAAQYYTRIYEDVAALRLDETIKDLSHDVAERDEEIKRLQGRITALEEEVSSFQSIRAENTRLLRKQEETDKFMRDQLLRNATIMKMATTGTGGVIPAHVVAAMLNVGNGSLPAGKSGRRSTKMRQSVAGSVYAGGPNNPGGEGTGTDGASFVNQALLGSGEVIQGGLDGPQGGSVYNIAMDRGSPTAADGASSAFSAPPFFLQSSALAFGRTEQTIGTYDDSTMSDTMDTGGGVESPFSRYELVDAQVQTTLDDVVDVQLMGEMHAYFTEMDKSSNYSQILCRVLYGTTDFYNPSECCDNARRLLDEISLRAQQTKDSVTVGSGDSSKMLHAMLAASSAGGKTNFTALMGHYEITKAKLVKLLQYGANAAREMRLRFASMAENDAFRRAVEWRPPRGVRDPCRMCNRLGELPEDRQAIIDATTLKERITVMSAELDAAKAEQERLSKRLEFEQKISQQRADDLEAIVRVRKSMVHCVTQTEPPPVRFASACQTEIAGLNSVPTVMLAPPSSSNVVRLSGVDSLSVTPTVVPSEPDKSPFATASTSDWPQGGGGTDATFVTRSAVVSARRRTSVEVTFDPDALEKDGVVTSLSGSRLPSADRRATRAGFSPIKPSPGSFPVAHRAGTSPIEEPSVLTRQVSDFSVAALRYRDAFMAFGRGGQQASTQGVRSRSNSITSNSTSKSSNSDGGGGSGSSRNGIAFDAALNLPTAQIKSHSWAIKMLGALYRSKFSTSSSSEQMRTISPTESLSFSCSKHFTDFLRQNFGTKTLLEDNAACFLRTASNFRISDSRFDLFSRLFSDEFHRDVYRIFLSFSSMLDQLLPQYDALAVSKKGDEQAEPSTIPLECILHAIHALFVNNDRIQSREEYCNLLATKAVALSTVKANTSPGGDSSMSSRSRRASTVAVKAFEPVDAVPSLGTAIEASDSFSKYRSMFHCRIPQDAPQRVVLRIAFLTYLCDVSRPYVVRPMLSTLDDSTPISQTTSRPGSTTLDAF